MSLFPACSSFTKEKTIQCSAPSDTEINSNLQAGYRERLSYFEKHAKYLFFEIHIVFFLSAANLKKEFISLIAFCQAFFNKFNFEGF